MVSRFRPEVLSDSGSESCGNPDFHESTEDDDYEHHDSEDCDDGECVQDIFAMLNM